MILQNEFEDYLKTRVYENVQGNVKNAMAYSLLAGGKRVRPQLLFACMKGYGLDPTIGFPAACGIEMIHTYSLIHDDLPAMDNDDYRRGRLSCHKAFDEATAILAGDGLLTKAFEVASDSPSDKIKDVILYLSQYAGVDGMIYGQELDIAAEKDNEPTIEKLYAIDEYKTAKLLTLPLIMSCVLSEHKEDIETMKKIGYNLGLQFQILDDILDVTQSSEELGKSTSDIENNKMTAVSLLGLEQAKKAVLDLQYEANELLKSLHMDTSYLQEIINFLTKRTY